MTVLNQSANAWLVRFKAMAVGAFILIGLVSAMRWLIFPIPYGDDMASIMVQHMAAFLVLVPVLTFLWVSTLVGLFVIGKKLQVVDK